MGFRNYQFILNKNLEFVSANNNFRNLLGLSERYELEGKRNHELPHVISEQAEELDAHDLLVITEQKTISGLTIDVFNDQLRFLYNSVIPLYQNEILVGCEVRLNEIQLYSSRDIILHNMPKHMVFQAPSLIFTEKEYEVLFLLFSRFSRAEISRILNITISSVSSRINSCLDKAVCLNIDQLMEYYHNTGLYSYLPKMFRKKGHIVLL